MARFLQLEERLSARGWKTMLLEPTEVWWAYEIWKIQFTWHPVGAVLYLTLVLDPMDLYLSRKPADTDVWSLELNFQYSPQGRLPADSEFFLKPLFKQAIDDICFEADKMRDALAKHGS